jgi:RNase P/RNase MRP subunit POP5
MKSIKPSHREKKRYLLIEGKDTNKKEIDEAILKYVGILGYSKASPQIIKEKSNKAVLAINRTELDKIRASFLISGKDIKIKKVSGSVKNL